MYLGVGRIDSNPELTEVYLVHGFGHTEPNFLNLQPKGLPEDTV